MVYGSYLIMLHKSLKYYALTLPEHMILLPVFREVRVTRYLVLFVCFVDCCLAFCTFFFWPLCCLFFFDTRIAITTLVSSNSSYTTACSLYKYVVQRHSLLSTDIFNTKHFAIILLPIKAWTKRVLICSFKTNYVKSESQLLSLFLLNKIFNIRSRTLIYLVISCRKIVYKSPTSHVNLNKIVCDIEILWICKTWVWRLRVFVI